MDVQGFWKNHQICNKCGDTKIMTDFYAKPDNKTGYGKICKDCARAEAAARRALKQTNQSLGKPLLRDKRTTTQAGFLYVMTNPAFVGYFRVGVTSDPAGLLDEANSIDPHAKWEIICQRPVSDIAMAELRILSSTALNTDKWGWCSSPDKEQIVTQVRALIDEEVDSPNTGSINNQFFG